MRSPSLFGTVLPEFMATLEAGEAFPRASREHRSAGLPKAYRSINAYGLIEPITFSDSDR